MVPNSARAPIFLGDFQIVRPRHEIAQGELNHWTMKRHLASREIAPSDDLTALQYEKIYQRYAIKENLIATRSFECSDVYASSLAEAEIYPVSPSRLSGVGIGSRAHFFSERAQSVFDEFYGRVERPPSHLIHVTCTGYRSPSAAQLLVARKGWNVDITHAYHMGCYASLPSIRIAEGFIAACGADPQFHVDLVHTEMCGLHMNPAAHIPEQIVVQSLFADGHVKYSVRPWTEGGPGFRVLAIREEIVPDSEADMSWVTEDWGFQMTLSRDVPEKIRQKVDGFFKSLAEQAGLDRDELLKSALFAVHPGGPKIIQSVQEMLELSEEQTSASRKVLMTRGNMSSATLPHVWNEISRQALPPGTKIVSFAFGPGLTIFGSVFETSQ